MSDEVPCYGCGKVKKVQTHVYLAPKHEVVLCGSLAYDTPSIVCLRKAHDRLRGKRICLGCGDEGGARWNWAYGGEPHGLCSTCAANLAYGKEHREATQRTERDLERGLLVELAETVVSGYARIWGQGTPQGRILRLLHDAVVFAKQEAYAKGLEAGRNLLLQLQAGEVTAKELNATEAPNKIVYTGDLEAERRETLVRLAEEVLDKEVGR